MFDRVLNKMETVCQEKCIDQKILRFLRILPSTDCHIWSMRRTAF